ncbi:glutathione S-transferase [Trametes punicea]|nr:glutathione S-transferase [Trametes punicea]
MQHPEKLPSAIERFQKEILRVFSVLDSVLSKREWLVGDKCTVADLSFIPWNVIAVTLFLKDHSGFNSLESDFPALNKWHNALMARPAVQKVYATKAEVSKA